MILFLLSLFACNPVPYGNACQNYAELFCETCPSEGWDKASCTCIDAGTLTAADLPEGTDLTNDEAAAWCDQLRARLDYPGPSTAASCKQDLEFLQKYEKEACPVEAPDTTLDTSDTTGGTTTL